MTISYRFLSLNFFNIICL